MIKEQAVGLAIEKFSGEIMCYLEFKRKFAKYVDIALHTLLMMTAESMLSKRPVLRFTAALFFLLKPFSSHIYCIPTYYTFACSRF